jgi:peptidoglycan/xylan/chitin deacetylase (PgdA/CDA1 family)
MVEDHLTSRETRHMGKLFLLRYDTEAGTSWMPGMLGFLEKAVEEHRRHAIPATFFCMGKAVETREAEFRTFFEEVKDDPLFDLQDHSYTHVGIGYRDGRPVDELRRDYAQSFAVHERVFGRRPPGTSLCGTSGKDGPRLDGFDATEKSRVEFDMLVGLSCLG